MLCSIAFLCSSVMCGVSGSSLSFPSSHGNLIMSCNLKLPLLNMDAVEYIFRRVASHRFLSVYARFLNIHTHSFASISSRKCSTLTTLYSKHRSLKSSLVLKGLLLTGLLPGWLFCNVTVEVGCKPIHEHAEVFRVLVHPVHKGFKING